MKLNKQKKGMVLILSLAVLFVFVIMPMLFVRIESKKSQFPKTIGQTQLTLLGTYQKSEKALFYIDQAAKYSAQQALSDLDFTIEDLKDSDSKKVFELTFKQYLDEYLKAYPEIGIPLGNYDILVKDDKIIGIANKHMITKEEAITYSIKPSFTIEIE